MNQRTQILLEPGQHAALLKEARKTGVSLAALIRKLVDEHMAKSQGGVDDAVQRKRAALSLIGLGSSGRRDVSTHPDEYLAAALEEQVLKERPEGYGLRRRKAR